MKLNIFIYLQQLLKMWLIFVYIVVNTKQAVKDEKIKESYNIFHDIMSTVSHAHQNINHYSLKYTKIIHCLTTQKINVYFDMKRYNRFKKFLKYWQ